MRFLHSFLIICVCFLGSDVFAAEKITPEEDFKMRNFIYEGAGFLAQGQTARALARFTAAQKINPENPECYYWLALTYSDLQNFGVAAKNAETAVTLDPKMVKGWLLWGQCLLYQNKYEDAKSKLERAFRLEPNNYLAAFNLGRCLYYGFDGKQKSLALRFFRRAWELNENFVPARYYAGCIQLESDMLPLAIVSFRWVISKEPRNIDAHYRLGVAYRKDNHIAKAENEFMEVLAIDPDNYESHLQLGHIYLIEKPSREKAIKHFNAFLRLAPADHSWRERINNLLERDRERQKRRNG